MEKYRLEAAATQLSQAIALGVKMGIFTLPKGPYLPAGSSIECPLTVFKFRA